MTNRLIVFDTTLRDGEQSPGASMTADEKMRLARQLERLKVDVIEAGFPAASPGDFDAVQRIAEQVRETTICGLARANARDVGLAADAVKPAESPRIHTFIATSPIHMREKLRMSPDQVLEQAVLSVKQAKNSAGDVEFSPEDAGRSDEDFLCRILEAVIDAGATTINIPDTVGYTMPTQFGELIGNLMERIPNSDKAVFSVHCHTLRLARFNTQDTKGNRYFRGLPCPAAAVLAATGLWTVESYGLTGIWIVVSALMIMVLLSAAMVSSFPYRSFKDLDLKDRVPFMALLALVLVFVLISFDPPVVLFLLSVGFALSGPFFWLFGEKPESLSFADESDIEIEEEATEIRAVGSGVDK